MPATRPAGAPTFIKPALATLRNAVPLSAGYVHEAKLDGYRLQAHLHEGLMTLYTRSGLDWTSRFRPIAEDVARLPAARLALDGEVIAADATGRADFSALQEDLRRGRDDRFVYYVFDILQLDDHNMRSAPLVERRQALAAVLERARLDAPRVFYTEHFEDGEALLANAAAMGLEGIVSKSAAAPYPCGRTEQWIKVKCLKNASVRSCWFRPGERWRHPQAPDRAAGGAGVGVRGARRHRLGSPDREGDPARAAAACAALVPAREAAKKGPHRVVEPRFEADVVYAEFTSDGLLRHPSFKALVS